MADLRMSGPSPAILLLAMAASAILAQAQTNIQDAAAKTCAVMSGQRKADGQTLQYLLLLDQDAADVNPAAIALRREVVNQCPEAYLDYQQRKRVNSPFPAGSLVKQNSTSLVNQNPTSLVNSDNEFPIRCRGTHSMASADGKTPSLCLESATVPRIRRCNPGNAPGLTAECANELTRIADRRPTLVEMDSLGRQRRYVFQSNGVCERHAELKALTNVANRILDRRRIGEVVRKEEVLELLRCWRQTVRPKSTSGSYLHGEFHETTDR